MTKSRLMGLFFIGLISLLAACRQQQTAAGDIQLELSASDTLVGETTLIVTVRDADGKKLEHPGKLTIRGDMNHAGMTPVLAETDQAVDGVFSLPFHWTMGGGWIVEATLTRPNGAVARQTYSIEVLTEAGVDTASDKNHSAMNHDALMRGETSAVYMRVSNRGDADITLLTASSAAAARIEFHHTVIENDIARMEKLDGLRIPAGETLELAPGGAHIMLFDLQRDLPLDSRLALQLTCAKGETYDLDISVKNMLMGELDDAVELGDLVFSHRWARPASARPPSS